jgi:5'-3' exonuclease
MGIDDLKPLIRDQCPDAFLLILATAFSGKRIAIDALNWMYTNMAIARQQIINDTNLGIEDPNPTRIRKEFFRKMLEFVAMWLRYGVTPVFVFDGKAPPEKDAVKAERQALREQQQIVIDTLTMQLRGYDVLLQPAHILIELRKKMCGHNNVPREEVDIFKAILRGIGIPALQAVGEGEGLCTQLCLQGKVAAVFSADTDNLAYGCPLLITKMGGHYYHEGTRIHQYECIRLDKVVDGLKMSHTEFVDLCILLGCDYNKGIKGVGKKTAFKLMGTYRALENIPSRYDVTVLNYQRCRDMFSMAWRGLCETQPFAELRESPQTPARSTNQDESRTKVESIPDIPGERMASFLPIREATQWDNVGHFYELPEPTPCDPNSLDINVSALMQARRFLAIVGHEAYLSEFQVLYSKIFCEDGHSPHLRFAPVALGTSRTLSPNSPTTPPATHCFEVIDDIPSPGLPPQVSFSNNQTLQAFQPFSQPGQSYQHLNQQPNYPVYPGQMGGLTLEISD